MHIFNVYIFIYKYNFNIKKYMSISKGGGRLGNQIIRNLAANIICKKHDLYCNYFDYLNSYESIKQLGINLFIGKNIYNNTILLTEESYPLIYESNELFTNNLMISDFFQTDYVMQLIYKYLRNDEIKENIINANPFKDRYNSNNDLLIHIRLDDLAYCNPGNNFYFKAISNINNFDNLYITTDQKDHDIIKQIIEKYQNAIIIDYDEIKTIQFASTCKNIILTYGTFSTIIGYLAYYSNIYYSAFEKNQQYIACHLGMITNIPDWIKIDY